MTSKLVPSTNSQVGSQLEEQVVNTRAPTVIMATPAKKMMSRIMTADKHEEATCVDSC